MKVLVTGANGFLASNIIRELGSRGITVQGMVRRNYNEKSLAGLDIHLVYGDIVNYPDVKAAVEGCDIVIHAAANTSQLYSDPLPLHPVNVNGTLNVVRAVQECGARRLIFVSTANTLDIEGDSATGISRYYRKSGYALSKLKAERQILNEVLAGRLDAVIVNPTFMLGAWDAKPSSGRIFMHYLKHRVVFLPPGGKNFIDVKCVATAICNAITCGKNGTKYLLAGKNLSFREFSAILNRTVNRRSIDIRIPSVILMAAGATGSLLRMAGIRTELNYYNAKILSMHENLSGEKAISELAMPETNLESAIRDAVNWFKSNGYFC